MPLPPGKVEMKMPPPDAERKPSSLPTRVMLDLIDQKAADGPVALRKLTRYALQYIGDVTILAGNGVEPGSHMDVCMQRIVNHLEASECQEEFQNLARVLKSARQQYTDRQAAMVEDLAAPKAEA